MQTTMIKIIMLKIYMHTMIIKIITLKMWRQGRDGRSDIAQEAVRRCDDGAWPSKNDVDVDDFDDD